MEHTKLVNAIYTFIGSPFLLSVTGDVSNKKRTIGSITLNEITPLKTAENATLYLKLPGICGRFIMKFLYLK